MKCPRCEHDNAPRAAFCVACGAPVTARCPDCGSHLAAGGKFCPGCGRAVERAVGQTPVETAGRDRHERALASRSAIEGERKQVTVLFADLKSSLELIHGRDPEEARALLDVVLEQMIEAVRHYGGTVNQIMGDGIMALFGAPMAQEDHAVRACYAALRMLENVARAGERIHRSLGITPRVRVGLNSGEVVVRSIAGDLHMDYTAVGETTHLAARMEQVAEPSSVLATARTVRLAGPLIQTKPRGPIALKGRAELLEVYEVVGAAPPGSRARFQAPPTRFVGRGTEFRSLGDALGRAHDGRGHIVAIVGEPGVGKSRLVWEFIHSPLTEGWRVLETSGVSYGKDSPHLPVIALLKAYFGLDDRDGPARIRATVSEALSALDPGPRVSLDALLALLDVPSADPQWETLDPLQRRQRILEGITRLLLRESETRPLLLVIEDLQWIDSETQALLDSIVERLADARLLLIITYRPGYRDRWGPSGASARPSGPAAGPSASYTRVPIEALSPETSYAFLRELLGDDAALQPLKRSLVERTEGNPFFLEESVRTLVETGVLVGERGAVRLGKPATAVVVPPTVQAVLASRIDRLDDDQKRLLQTASVIGKDFPLALLEGVTEMPAEQLRGCLPALRAAEFVYEKTLFPDIEYTFTHALTYDVAYASLLHERRRVLHARIVSLMEMLYAERLGEHLDRLAHHAVRGEVWDKALRYLRQGGQRALARSAYREAEAWYQQALAALSHLPESPEHHEQAIDLRFDLRNALLALGEHERILDLLREAETLAQSLGDRRRQAWALVYRTTYLWNAGDPEQAVDSGRRALAIGQELGDFALTVVANIGLAWAYHALGDYRPAVEVLESTVASLKGDLVGQRFGLAALPAVVARTWLAWCLAARGEFPESRARAEEGVRIAQEADHPYSLAIAHFGLGIGHLSRRDVEDAIPVLERGLDVCRTFDIRTWLTALASALGYAYALSARVEQALPLLVEAVDTAAAMRSRFRQAMRTAWLGEALLIGGQRDVARVRAREALDLARRHRERGHEAQVLCLLGELAASAVPPDVGEAQACFGRALELAAELEMRPLVAQAHLGAGRLLRASGRRNEGDEHLRQAERLCREMGMRGWQAAAEAELAAPA